LESEILDQFMGYVKQNTEENKETVDYILNSFFSLLSSIVQYQPDQLNELEDQGKLSILMDSLHKRIPLDKRIIPTIFQFLTELNKKPDLFKKYMENSDLVHRLIRGMVENDALSKFYLDDQNLNIWSG